MFSIVLIGAGQMGSRHLQGLSKIDIPVAIEVINPNADSLRIAKQRFEEVCNPELRIRVNYSLDIDVIPEHIDLCIVATRADVRAKVLKQLLNKSYVRNIILEKVIFQSIQDINEIELLFQLKSTNAWVNCVRRLYPEYIWLKTMLKDGETVSLTAKGGNWGLGCNAIHFFDLLAFLAGQDSFEIDPSGLDKQTHKSKRKNCIEFSGTLMGQINQGGHHITLCANKDSSNAVTIDIKTKNLEVVINEYSGLMQITKNGYIKKSSFKDLLQSNLTHIVAKDILLEGRCGLTSFSESCQIHRPYLGAFTKHLNTIEGKVFDYCPIT